MPTPFVVPLSNQLPWYRFTITFSGTVYTVNARFNSRSNRWVLDLLDSQGNQVLVGIPVLISRDLTHAYAYLSIPPGTFLCTDDTGQGNQPTLFSFGLTNTLWYISP